MKEWMIIAILVWFVIGTIKFLRNMEQTPIQFQISGIDWLVMLPFYLVFKITSKTVKVDNGN